MTNFVKWMRLDLRELVLHVVWVHGTDLLAGWGTEHFDNLHKLINARTLQGTMVDRASALP